MEKDKHEEPKCAEVTKTSEDVGGARLIILNRLAMFKSERLRSSIMEWVNARSCMRSQSPLTRFMIMAVAAIGLFMLQGVLLLDFTTLGDTMRARISTLRSSYSIILRPPQRVCQDNGYLMVSCNGGLNQMRGGISDMVAIARYLNLTFIIPDLDNSSFWNDGSGFEDIFDIEYFIQSLRDEVQILKQLPPEVKHKVERKYLYSMTPPSWSNISYY